MQHSAITTRSTADQAAADARACGPQLLAMDDLLLVGGGLPKGGWGIEPTAALPNGGGGATSNASALPKGGWG